MGERRKVQRTSLELEVDLNNPCVEKSLEHLLALSFCVEIVSAFFFESSLYGAWSAVVDRTFFLPDVVFI
jgi:hypothetical protein